MQLDNKSGHTHAAASTFMTLPFMCNRVLVQSRLLSHSCATVCLCQRKLPQSRLLSVGPTCNITLVKFYIKVQLKH